MYFYTSVYKHNIYLEKSTLVLLELKAIKNAISRKL